MRTVLCSFVQGTLSNDQVRQLGASLERVYAEQLGRQPLRILWCELPAGQAFTEARPSDIAYVMVEVENGLDQSRREAAMLALADEWARVANVGVDKLMITLADGALFHSYLKANRDRIRPVSRPWFLATTLAHLWASRRRKGYLAIRSNL